MQHGAYYARGAWGQLKRVSNDKGPHKLVTVECDGQPVECVVGESFGIQSSPHMDAMCYVLFQDGDNGKGIILFALPRPKDRVDQQKEGEVTMKNHDTGNAIKHDADGNTAHTAKGKITTHSGGDTVITTDGELHLN